MLYGICKRRYDYSSAGGYFVTICTERRIYLFGDVRDGGMRLSPAGVMIEPWWHTIPSRFPSFMLDTMVVMPNHLHDGVIHLDTDPEATDIPKLSDVMHWFKVRTTYDYTLGVKMEGWPRFPGKLWQVKYHDHIIRTERGLEQIEAYIEGNPWRWEDDEYNQRESV